MGEPHMTCFAIASCDPDIDIYAVADVMEKKGTDHAYHYNIYKWIYTAILITLVNPGVWTQI